MTPGGGADQFIFISFFTVLLFKYSLIKESMYHNITALLLLFYLLDNL